MIQHLLLCAAGFLMLYYGADWLVKGSSSLARSLGITPVVMGLTVVAFGTSAPEFVVSLISSIQGKSMIAVGNVIGSNICNIALVLGLSAVFRPVKGDRSVVRRDIPVMLGVSLFLLLLSLDSKLERFEGIMLFTGIVIYTLFNYHAAKTKETPGAKVKSADIESYSHQIEYIVSRKKQVVLILAGIVCVVAGAQIVVDAAVVIMKKIGVDEKFIGLTIVAFGTSLPELATSVVAALRNEMDISIGNLIGSNVFNILGVLGVAAMVRPTWVPGGIVESGLIFDYLAMMFISFLPWIMMRKSGVLNRKGGLFLLTCYGFYIVYLINA